MPLKIWLRGSNMKNSNSSDIHGTKCPAPELVMDYLTGELDGIAAEVFEKHLTSCTSCRVLIDDMKNVAAELNSLPADKRNREDLVEKIMWKTSVAGAGHEDGGFPMSMFLRIAASFAVLSLALLGFRVLQQGDVSRSDVAMQTGQDKPAVKDNIVAVRDTLKWLTAVQLPTGGWDASAWGGKSEYSLALNGLALMTFARSGSMAGENIAVIQRSAKYLLNAQKGNGLFGAESEGMMYNHGIVSVALLEAYAVTRDTDLKPSIDRALAFIRMQQLHTGGWGYFNRPGENANTPVTLWQLQALILSTKLGWDDKGYSLKRGVRWFSSMIDSGGQLGYERPSQFPEGSSTLTAMGAFCMFSASDVEKVPDTGVLMRLQKAFDALKHEDAPADYYGGYFRAAAIKTLGGNCQLDERLKKLQYSLIARQEQTGGNAGSWSPGDRWGAVGGRIYSTSVAGLTLELINRNSGAAVPF